MSRRSVQVALSAWRAATRRLDRVLRSRRRNAEDPTADGRREAQFARLEGEAREAEAAAHERYDRASDTIWYHDCARCHQRLATDDVVVQGVREMDVTTFGDEGPQGLEGHTAIVHEDHWPPEGTGWVEIYRGSLSGIRPG